MDRTRTRPDRPQRTHDAPPGGGAALAAAGMALVVLNGRFVLHLAPAGDLLALAAALMWMVYSLVIKRLGDRYAAAFVARKVFFLRHPDHSARIPPAAVRRPGRTTRTTRRLGQPALSGHRGLGRLLCPLERRHAPTGRRTGHELHLYQSVGYNAHGGTLYRRAHHPRSHGGCRNDSLRHVVRGATGKRS